MTHDLADLPMPPPLPRGGALAPGGWDADLASAVAEAYGPDHSDGPRSEQDTAQVAAAHTGTAAIVFARRSYAAIASAQPVGIALAQAQAAMRLTTPDDADPPQVALRDDIDADSLVLVRPPRSEPPADPAHALLRTHGLSPLAAALLRHVQNLESDQVFAGVLSDTDAALAADSTPHAARNELKRLLSSGYLEGGYEADDLGGGYDISDPRLTTRGVAAIAGT
jgi:hypothetical protein